MGQAWPSGRSSVAAQQPAESLVGDHMAFGGHVVRVRSRRMQEAWIQPVWMLFVTALCPKSVRLALPLVEERTPRGRKPRGVLLYGAHVGAVQAVGCDGAGCGGHAGGARRVKRSRAETGRKCSRTLRAGTWVNNPRAEKGGVELDALRTRLDHAEASSHAPAGRAAGALAAAHRRSSPAPTRRLPTRRRAWGRGATDSKPWSSGRTATRRTKPCSGLASG